MAKVYALLVGINAYPPGVRSLEGCLNDVDNLQDYLKERVPDAAILALKDQDATRDNVIAQFRAHLGQAGKDDVALFHYCGHGSPATAAPEFREFDLSGKDQGIVCYDSRLDNDHFDLADKELARLIEEVAADDPHIALILDCCHSGSGTRDLGELPEPGVRSTPGVPYVRPLETYLDGYYAALRQQGKPLAVPVARHILLAACDRTQTAKEDLETHRGIFTTNLCDVLRKSPDPLTYADLFVRSRAAVRRYIFDKQETGQDPQFEARGDFDAYAGFLGLATAQSRKSYSVHYDRDRWRVDCGAVEGLSTDPAVPVRMALYPEAGDQQAGVAATVRVGAQSSDVALDFDGDPAMRYRAEIISLPAAPLAVAFEGDDSVRKDLETALAADSTANVVLVAPGTDDGYRLVQRAEVLGIEALDAALQVQKAAIGPASGWTERPVRLLKHVAQWQRSFALRNPRPQLDPALVDFVFAQQGDDGSEQIHDGADIALESTQKDGAWHAVEGKLKLRNRSAQTLNFVLLHFTSDYGVDVMANDQVAPGGDWMTMIVGKTRPSPRVRFSVDDGAERTLERLKLVVSTERVDDFLLELAPLASDRGFGSADELPDEAAKPASDDWFVKDMRVTVARAAAPPVAGDPPPAVGLAS